MRFHGLVYAPGERWIGASWHRRTSTLTVLILPCVGFILAFNRDFRGFE